MLMQILKYVPNYVQKTCQKKRGGEQNEKKNRKDKAAGCIIPRVKLLFSQMYNFRIALCAS